MTISLSKVLRLARYLLIALGIGAGFAGMWVEGWAMHEDVPPSSRTAAVTFHSTVEMVTPEAARIYYWCLVVFFTCLAGTLLTGFAERLLMLDSEEDDRT